jgi:septum formation protein
VIGSQFEENLDKTHFQQPYEYAVKNATCKALEVYHRLYKEQPNTRPVLIIGADTIVVNQQTILEKPRSKEQAIHMISQLQGKQHATYTGIAFVYDGSNGPETHSFYEATTVVFAPMDERTIEAYVSTGEPMDKAGAYGIQGFASCFISGIQGDYYNVVSSPYTHTHTHTHTHCSSIFRLGWITTSSHLH